MSLVDHPNVLTLYGICMLNNILQIIMPFRSKGSLSSFLKAEENQIQELLLLDFCRQITSVSVVILDLSWVLSKSFEHEVEPKHCFFQKNLQHRVQ
jgi:serine/threonine protein kinase